MKKKLLIVSIVFMLVLTVLVVPVSAASGSATKSMKNSTSTTSYSCSFWGQSNFWDIWWGANGTSNTSWWGSTPYNADSITHRDILSCSGIGSMGVGISPSGPNASASISGHTATYSYTVSNRWKIEVSYSYKHTGLLSGWNYSMRTSATVQFGSSFYTWGT